MSLCWLHRCCCWPVLLVMVLLLLLLCCLLVPALGNPLALLALLLQVVVVLLWCLLALALVQLFALFALPPALCHSLHLTHQPLLRCALLLPETLEVLLLQWLPLQGCASRL